LSANKNTQIDKNTEYAVFYFIFLLQVNIPKMEFNLPCSKMLSNGHLCACPCLRWNGANRYYYLIIGVLGLPATVSMGMVEIAALMISSKE
jgi:hypothetical protein